MDWQQIATGLVAGLVPIGGTMITAAVTIGAKYLISYMAAKTRSENLRSAMLQLSQATINAVMDTEAQVRKYMSDGVLSKEEQDQLRESARTRITTQVPQALQVLVNAGYKDLESYINGEIEKAVAAMPDSNPKPEAAKPEVSGQRSEVSQMHGAGEDPDLSSPAR